VAVETDNVLRIDGRAARSVRTRSAIVEGLLGLLDDGVVQPTVEEIAARAGVAPRTVFQHYADREALFAAVSEAQVRRIAPMLERLPVDGPLDERLDALVAQRARVYEAITSVRRAALLMEPFSEHTSAMLAGTREAKRREVEQVFALELDARPAAERPLLRAALGATASWSAWDALRSQQGLDVEQAAAALRQTLRALLTATG
jgi:TetR/AcrR family transcriptional regulator, regulator of autoinduction and epiphytic fitness